MSGNVTFSSSTSGSVQFSSSSLTSPQASLSPSMTSTSESPQTTSHAKSAAKTTQQFADLNIGAETNSKNESEELNRLRIFCSQQTAEITQLKGSLVQAQTKIADLTKQLTLAATATNLDAARIKDLTNQLAEANKKILDQQQEILSFEWSQREEKLRYCERWADPADGRAWMGSVEDMMPFEPPHQPSGPNLDFLRKPLGSTITKQEFELAQQHAKDADPIFRVGDRVIIKRKAGTLSEHLQLVEITAIRKDRFGFKDSNEAETKPLYTGKDHFLLKIKKELCKPEATPSKMPSGGSAAAPGPQMQAPALPKSPLEATKPVPDMSVFKKKKLGDNFTIEEVALIRAHGVDKAPLGNGDIALILQDAGKTTAYWQLKEYWKFQQVRADHIVKVKKELFRDIMELSQPYFEPPSEAEIKAKLDHAAQLLQQRNPKGSAAAKVQSVDELLAMRIPDEPIAGKADIAYDYGTVPQAVNPQLMGARTEAMEGFVSGLEGFNSSTKMNLQFRGSMYNILHGQLTIRSAHLAKTFDQPFMSIGSAKEREIISYEHRFSPTIDAHFQALKSKLEAQRKANPSMTTEDVLRFIKDYVRTQIFTKKGNLEARIKELSKASNLSITKYGNGIQTTQVPVVPLDTFVKEGVGVCRHHAFVTWILISMLVREPNPILKGVIHHVRDNVVTVRSKEGAHTWTVFVPKREKESDPKEVWLLDTLWNELSNLGNPSEKEMSGVFYSKKTIEDLLQRLEGTIKDMHAVDASKLSAAGSAESASGQK
jgi:hypothetical protein